MVHPSVSSRTMKWTSPFGSAVGTAPIGTVILMLPSDCTATECCTGGPQAAPGQVQDGDGGSAVGGEAGSAQGELAAATGRLAGIAAKLAARTGHSPRRPRINSRTTPSNVAVSIKLSTKSISTCTPKETPS